MKRWANVNAFYQIYVRSFKDSNGDGIGDLQGIIDKFDYIKGNPDSLGVDAIWLSPFYPSPMADFGYDVSDYRGVHPIFGSTDDLKRLIDTAHSRDVKVMIDYVLNHSSHEHPWFVESRSSKDNPMRDFYVWRDPKPDGSPPNNWLSIFGGPAWTLDETTGQYYLHTFLKEQPDLNWDNVKVRWEMKQILRYWFELGIDGIRADAVRHIAKDPDLRDDLLNPSWQPGGDPYGSLIHSNSKYGRDLFRYLREMTDVVEEYDDRIMIFEDYPDSIYSTRDQYLGFYGINPDVSMPFNFEGMHLPWSSEAFSKFVNDFQGMLRPEHVPVYCFGNHDQPRLASRFGGKEKARLIALAQLTLPGLPVVYYGDELGMENVEVPPTKVQDPPEIKNPGIGLGRDPERTPMRWDSSAYAGFSEVEPWLPVGEGYENNSVERQQTDPDSFLVLYKTLLKLRKENDAMRSGHYHEIPDNNENTFVYERSHDSERYIVALNFSDQETRIILPITSGETACSTHPNRPLAMNENGELYMLPYEGVLIKVKDGQ